MIFCRQASAYFIIGILAPSITGCQSFGSDPSGDHSSADLAPAPKADESPIAEYSRSSPAKSQVDQPTPTPPAPAKAIPEAKPTSVTDPDSSRSAAQTTTAGRSPKKAAPPKATTILRGCLNDPRAPHEGGPIIEGQQDGVSARFLKGGKLRVTHNITTNCCLRAKTKTTIKGNRIVIKETLNGPLCDSRCSSSIITTIPTSLDEYFVQLDYESNGKNRTIFDQKISR